MIIENASQFWGSPSASKPCKTRAQKKASEAREKRFKKQAQNASESGSQYPHLSDVYSKLVKP